MATEIKYRIFRELQDYGAMLAFQEKTRNEILEGKYDGVIYFLEHDPVYTSGLRGTEDQFIKPLNGVPVYKIKRGGELTWHGPGQLVIYPVINIRKAGFASIRDFVTYFGKAIEQVLTGHCKINNALWVEEKAGVWVDDRKIAFSGLHFKKFVPIHGYSLNIDPELSFFSSIIPCGIPDCKITSIKAETGNKFNMYEISNEIVSVLKGKLPDLIEF
ncbi:MAG TPA: lipoyl(octanoyl) transferase LipB [bacterium]|nr:lipoyl(octanoyl) transferase LipB [bacterium]HPS30471.1 lipoyl(octanoyl) transferase LipB [bacterium]